MSTTTHASLAIALNKQGTTKKDYSVKTYFTRLFARVQSLTGVTTNKKFISVSCIVLVLAIMNVTPANAKIWTTLSGTQVTITANNIFEPATTTGGCDGEIMFNYYQRVVINGKTAMVATEFVYPENGTYTLYLEAQCGGYNLYSVGSCACISTDFINTVTITDIEPTSIMDTEPALAMDIEKTPEDTVKPDQLQLIIAPNYTGSLWIRKNL